MNPGARAMDQSVEWLNIGTRAGKPRTSEVVGSDGGPGGIWGSDGGMSDSDGESNLVTEPCLERWSWNLGGEYRKSIAGTRGISGGEIGFSS